MTETRKPKRGQRRSVTLTRETAAALTSAAQRVHAPSVSELLRVAASHPESIMRAYVLGVQAAANRAAAEFENWASPPATASDRPPARPSAVAPAASSQPAGRSAPASLEGTGRDVS